MLRLGISGPRDTEHRHVQRKVVEAYGGLLCNLLLPTSDGGMFVLPREERRQQMSIFRCAVISQEHAINTVRR
jgi:hypothetical protein